MVRSARTPLLTSMVMFTEGHRQCTKLLDCGGGDSETWLRLQASGRSTTEVSETDLSKAYYKRVYGTSVYGINVWQSKWRQMQYERGLRMW